MPNIRGEHDENSEELVSLKVRLRKQKKLFTFTKATYFSVIIQIIVYWQKLLAVLYPAAERFEKILMSVTDPSA